MYTITSHQSPRTTMPPSRHLLPLFLWWGCVLYYNHAACVLADNNNKVVSIPIRRSAFVPGSRRERQRRELDHDTVAFKEVARTKREGDGVYFTTLRIGTPPQTFSVILDTGSSTIAVPCKGCSCGNHHAFDMAQSSSYQEVGSYQQCYSEGSCNVGALLSDVACFGEGCVHNETVRHNFGCCRSYAKAFQEQDADGIIGLSNAPDTLIANLRQKHDLKANVFAVCFGRNAGTLTVGGTSLDPLLEEPLWIPLVNNGVFYAVDISAFVVNGVPALVPSSGQRPIIDSGSSFTYVFPGVHAGMKRSFEAFCAASGGSKCRGTKNPPGTVQADVRDAIACYAPPPGVSTQVELDAWLTSDFPTIEIEFATGPDGKPARICISPRSYFWLSTPAANAWCIGIFPDAKVVIGAISMSEFTVIFDADRRRVGWARSDCDGDGKPSEICCGSRSATCGLKPPTSLPTTAATLVPTTSSLLTTDTPAQNNDNTPAPASKASSTSPTREPRPKGFWEGGTKLISGYFFVLGMFFAAFLAMGWWCCCAKRNQVSFKAMNQVEPAQEYDSELEEEDDGEDDDVEVGENRLTNTATATTGVSTRNGSVSGGGGMAPGHETDELVVKRKGSSVVDGG